MSDKERDLVNDLLKILDAKENTMGEIISALLNVLVFVGLVGVGKEHREEVIALAINDIPKVINFLAAQLNMSFDWDLFHKFREIEEDPNA